MILFLRKCHSSGLLGATFIESFVVFVATCVRRGRAEKCFAKTKCHSQIEKKPLLSGSDGLNGQSLKFSFGICALISSLTSPTEKYLFRDARENILCLYLSSNLYVIIQMHLSSSLICAAMWTSAVLCTVIHYPRSGCFLTKQTCLSIHLNVL